MQYEQQEQGFAEVDVQRNTRWHNPTKDKLRIELLLKATTKESTMTVVFFEPGETKELDSKFDFSLQQLDEGGIIVGGLAPQLVNLTSGKRELSIALDPVALAKKKADEARNMAAVAAKNAQALAQQATETLVEEAKNRETAEELTKQVTESLDALTRPEPKPEHKPGQPPNQRR